VKKKPAGAPYSAAEIAAAWAEALALWDVEVTISPPEPLVRTKASHWPGGEPLAFIDMITRQVVVNLELLVSIGARGSLAAVLAHELGHHVRFPHTLGLSAQLELLERRLVPGLASSLTNLFFDLQVNEVVGRTHAAELAAVYRGFVAEDGDCGPLYWFYLAVYEELWGLEACELAPRAQAQAMEQRFPGVRAEARLFAQTFWSLPDVFLQFVYFCSRFIRFVDEPQKERGAFPMAGDVQSPDLDDWDGALQGSPAAEDALAEARERGWLDEKDGAAASAGDVFRRLSGLPGHAQAKFRAALVERQYRRLVDAHLFDIPATQPLPDPLLPTTTEDWQPGDDLRAIDWTASVLARGAFAGVAPLRRELEPDTPRAHAAELPAVEVYLDTSGSMPNPAQAENAMTLAALVLATAAIRRRGSVRAIVYSAGKPLVSPWMYDEELARRFLLQYAGGGTEYPFATLAAHARERDEVLRVVVSDGDFLHNARGQGALDVLADALPRSQAFVALLHVSPPQQEQAHKLFAPLAGDPRFRLAFVDDLGQFAAMARRLADALLPGK
jgi:Mg-chelatase subunit ChlD